MIARLVTALAALALLAGSAGCASRHQQQPPPAPQARDLGQGAGGEKLGRAAPSPEPTKSTTQEHQP